MSNSNYSIGLQRLKPVHTACCGHAQFGRRLVLGTSRKWPRPKRYRDVDNFSRDEADTRRRYVSRPSRDRDVETETTTLCIYGECAHKQHVRRILTHTITAYSVSANVPVRILICATRQKPCRKRVYPEARGKERILSRKGGN